jgi:signal recognition particle receptor subunit beta
MPIVDSAQRRITFKLVYEGPPFSGKTANLERIHADLRASEKSPIWSPSPEADRMLFLDVTPLQMGPIDGMTVRFQLATVPGREQFSASRKLVLRGVSGIVFVADSSPDAMPRNRAALETLEANLDLARVPHVFQWNKRDVPDALPFAELDALDRFGAPRIDAVARTGQGVFETLRELARRVLVSWRNDLDADLDHMQGSNGATG